MKRKLFRTIGLVLSAVIFLSSLLFVPSAAYSADAYLVSGEVYYIKNANSGRYLDVTGAGTASGTNVQQYAMNGTKAQMWKVVHVGSGLYKIVSMVGSANLVLDVFPGGSANGGNIDIYSDLGVSDQRFALVRTVDGSYVMRTACSNYTRVVTVDNASCSNRANVFQWQYNQTHNDEWFFEPVYKYSPTLGVKYAKENYNRRVSAYPDVSAIGGDCANFVSQCILAGGVHYQDVWWIYKKNNNYLAPSNTTQLDNSWSLSDPSPWISAKEFNKFWSKRVTVETYKGSYILAHKSEIFGRPFYSGDVIQILNKIPILGIVGDAWHTMYITGYGTYGGVYSFLLTYHSSNKLDKNLLQICEENPDDYYRFFTII
ncbi:MAG: RICIN domain-containing protein [Oscillospiraceae bacterium]|jgi:hypothetical protein|nr:RICIN domain-containing protein [Oscillospiraceae bacterium]